MNELCLFAGADSVVFILASWITAGMLGTGNKFEIPDLIVQPVPVEMVDIITFRDGAMMMLPNISVQECPAALGFPIISRVAERVLKPVDHDEWKRGGGRFLSS